MQSIDWPLIQQLYIQGATLHAISMQCGVKPGTIAARASRNGWRKVATAASEKMQLIQAREARQAEAESTNLDKASQDARKRVSRSILEALSVLPSPDDWKTAAKQQTALEPLVRNAKTVFGWGDDAAPCSVRISLLAQAGVHITVSDNKHAFPAVTAGDATGQPLSTRADAVGELSNNLSDFELSAPSLAGPVMDVACDPVATDKPADDAVDSGSALGGNVLSDQSSGV